VFAYQYSKTINILFVKYLTEHGIHAFSVHSGGQLWLFAPVGFVMKSILIEGSCSHTPAKGVDLGGTLGEVEHVEGDAGRSGKAYSQAVWSWGFLVSDSAL
jgi:hypothetical protein